MDPNMTVAQLRDEKRRLDASKPWPGSVGIPYLVLIAGAIWAEESGKPSLALPLAALVCTVTVAIVVWLLLPLYRAQRDPMLRSMGLIPWPVRHGARTPPASPRWREGAVGGGVAGSLAVVVVGGVLARMIPCWQM